MGKGEEFTEKDKERIQSNADKHPERKGLNDFKEKVQSKEDEKTDKK